MRTADRTRLLSLQSTFPGVLVSAWTLSTVYSWPLVYVSCTNHPHERDYLLALKTHVSNDWKSLEGLGDATSR